MRNIGLWIVQGGLAALFVFAGAMKLITPPELMAEQTPLPMLFIQFVGLAELLGGLGLVLPSLLRVRPGLSTLAAIELTHVMIGAVVLTLATGGGALAAIPAIVGLLLAFVAYARTHQSPASARVTNLDASGRGVYSAV